MGDEIVDIKTELMYFFEEFPPKHDAVFVSSIGTIGSGKSSLLKRISHELDYLMIEEEIVKDHNMQAEFARLWYIIQNSTKLTYDTAKALCKERGFPYLIDMMDYNILPKQIQREREMRNLEQEARYNELGRKWMDRTINEEKEFNNLKKLDPHQTRCIYWEGAWNREENIILSGGGTVYPDYIKLIGFYENSLFPVAFVAPGSHEFAYDFSPSKGFMRFVAGKGIKKFDPKDIFGITDIPGQEFADSYYFLIDAKLLKFFSENPQVSDDYDFSNNQNLEHIGFVTKKRMIENIIRDCQRVAKIPEDRKMIGILSHTGNENISSKELYQKALTVHTELIQSSDKNDNYLAEKDISEILKRAVSWHKLETRSTPPEEVVKIAVEAFRFAVERKNLEPEKAHLVNFSGMDFNGTINYKDALTEKQKEFLMIDDELIQFHKGRKEFREQQGFKPY